MGETSTQDSNEERKGRGRPKGKSKPRQEIPGKRKPGRPKRGELVEKKEKSTAPVGRPSTGFDKKEYDRSVSGVGFNLRLAPDSLAARARFYDAIDYLIESGALKGLAEFCRKYSLNLPNMLRLKTTPSAFFQVGLFIILVQDFKVSAHWLLTGEGSMMQNDIE